MFCGNCGSQIPEGASSCTNCGAPVKSASPAGKMSDFLKSFNYKDPKFLGIAAAVVAALVLVFMLFGGQSYKKAVDNFMDGVFDGDAKQVLKSLPDDLIDFMCEEEDMSRRELTNEMDEMLDEMLEELAYYAGDSWSVKHKITGTEKYDRDDLEDIKEMYDEIGIKVKDAKLVTVKITVKAYGMSQSMDIEIGVIKVGGSWYVDAENVDLDFF